MLRQKGLLPITAAVRFKENQHFSTYKKKHSEELQRFLFRDYPFLCKEKNALYYSIFLPSCCVIRRMRNGCPSTCMQDLWIWISYPSWPRSAKCRRWWTRCLIHPVGAELERSISHQINGSNRLPWCTASAVCCIWKQQYFNPPLTNIYIQFLFV